MTYEQILTNADDPQIENAKVTHLDVIGVGYAFDEFEMSVIAIVFPNVECVQVVWEIHVSTKIIHHFSRLRSLYRKKFNAEPEYQCPYVSPSRDYQKTWLGPTTFREHQPFEFVTIDPFDNGLQQHMNTCPDE